MSGIKAVANHLADQGRRGDSMLVHMNPQEAEFLERLAGKPMTRNPHTGLPEAFSLWKAIIGGALIAAAPFTGGLSAAIGLPLATGAAAALGAGAGVFGGSLLGQSMAPSNNAGDVAKAQAEEIAAKQKQAQNFVKVPIVQNIPSPAPNPRMGLPGTIPEQVAPMHSQVNGYISPGQEYYASGGTIEPYAQGGAMKGGDPEKIVADAIAAVQGRHPRPKQALEAFRKYFGDAEFQEFMQEMSQQSGDAEQPQQPQMAAPGGLLHGPGGGMDDKIPGSVQGRDPVALSGGEFVVPADVVAHLGDGSTEAGAQHLYGMLDRVRQTKTGKVRQPGKINAKRMLPA